MEKEKFKWRQIFNLKNLYIFLGSLVLGSLVFVIYCLAKNIDFNLLNLVDGMFLSASILMFVGLFEVILNAGTFDVIAVGFSNMFSFLKKDGTKKYDGIYGYKESKLEKRTKKRFRFIPIFTSGVVYLIIAFILRAIRYTTF